MSESRYKFKVGDKVRLLVDIQDVPTHEEAQANFYARAGFTTKVIKVFSADSVYEYIVAGAYVDYRGEAENGFGVHGCEMELVDTQRDRKPREPNVCNMY